MGLLLLPLPATAQLPNPTASGIKVAIEPWLTIPASNASAPRARINHLKPQPGSNRLFCNDLNGKLWLIEHTGANSASQFLDILSHFPEFIKSPGLGTGFASFAFHPEFMTPGSPGYGKFYTAHSEIAGEATDYAGPLSPATSQVGVIAEWTMNNPTDSAIVTSPPNFTKRTLLRIGFPYDYHDVQELAFDPTAGPGSENYGCLFICIGDGGSIVQDRPNNIGRIDSPLGAIHRITPILATGHDPADFTLSTNGAYYLPSGETNANPYIDSVDPTPDDGFPVVREIYAHGFRNPHRISWDPGGTGKMFCGNIGESRIEEVELVEKGRHYGWPHREGSFSFFYTDKTRVHPLPSPDSGGYTYPVVQYDHDTGSAIVGGYVYRGEAIPELYGYYVFGDIVNGSLFVSSEEDMNLLSNPVTGEAPAEPMTLGLKIGSTSTTFRSILGTSRADLRFGTDHEGELYLLSKQNGRLYKLLEDTSVAVNPPEGGRTDWTPISDFEDGSIEGISKTPSVGSSVSIVNDPREGASNRVLRLQAPGTVSQLTAHLPIPEVPENSYATLFFRFFVPNQDHNVNFGLSDVANPTVYSDFEMQMRSYLKNSRLDARSGGSFLESAQISTGTWYSVWSQIHNAPGTGGDTWNLYLQGGAYGAPTLIQSDIAFRNGTTASLKRFLWILAPITSSGAEAQKGAEMYFDDIHIDIGHANISDPTDADWQLVDHFEGPAPLASWQIPTPSAFTSLVAEADGNHYMRRTGSPGAIAAKRLPFDTQVSQTVTTFFRMRFEGTSLHHNLGISALNPENPSTYTENEFEAQIRLSGSGDLDVYDGLAGTNGFVPAKIGDQVIPPLLSGIWYNVWMVSSNAGFASGGQTWQAYIQGGEWKKPTAVTDVLYFHKGSESPITHFVSLASDGTSDEICLDDIYACRGVQLTNPIGLNPSPISLERDLNEITLHLPTTPNRAFQLMESSDLVTWSPFKDAVEGKGDVRQVVVPIDSPKRFFKAVEHSRRNFRDSTWSTSFPTSTLPAGMDTIRANSSASWTLVPGLLTLANTTGSSVAGMVGRPGGYTLAPGDWRNVTLTVEGRSLAADGTANRDLCLIFGYVDETHFYYAHLSRSADNSTHTVIMRVNGNLAANRSTIHTPIATGSSAGPLVSSVSNPVWHTIRVTHSASGQIHAYVDNMDLPVLSANDSTFPVGRVGFGTFDDPAVFRSVHITGQRH
jgi:hypothetical protein